MIQAGKRGRGPAALNYDELKKPKGVSMTVSERVVGNVTILDVSGNVTLNDGAEQVRDKVRSVLQQGQKYLLVNLSKVSYMDSAGLGELVQAYSTVAKQGGKLKLVSPTKRLQDLLVITKLATVFDSFDDEATGIASFPK
jgi:anti-sigma B factor antagonist